MVDFFDEFENEIWKDIPEYEGMYQVSNFGRIRSVDRIDNIGRKQKGQIIKSLSHDLGYQRVKLSKDGKLKNYLVHRLVAQAFLMLKGKAGEVNHKDGNKQNNHVDNLEWVTRSDNILHAFRTGITVRKLDVEAVNFIRRNYKRNHKKYGAIPLAERFGVTPQTIHNVMANRNHKDDEYKKRRRKRNHESSKKQHKTS